MRSAVGGIDHSARPAEGNVSMPLATDAPSISSQPCRGCASKVSLMVAAPTGWAVVIGGWPGCTTVGWTTGPVAGCCPDAVAGWPVVVAVGVAAPPAPDVRETSSIASPPCWDMNPTPPAGSGWGSVAVMSCCPPTDTVSCPPLTWSPI
ncbi:MAG: hypothetical protein U9R79_20290 [Armatimonadota bacterium]|nr:hypothetical protein [Armatimonadota bacterium]